MNDSKKQFFTFFDRFVLVFFLLTMAMVLMLYNNQTFVEVHYTQNFYPYIASSLSFVSTIFPFSIWDLFWVLFVFTVAILLYLSIFGKGRRLKSIKRIVLLFLFGIAWFYWSWGFNYFREPAENRFSLPTVSNDSTLLLQSLDVIIDGVNSNYILSDSVDKVAVDQLLEEAFAHNKEKFKINYPMGYRRPKEMMFSTFYAKTGILGYFGPFFNEVHVNSNLLPFEYPFTLAHEKSHQLGVTSEAECNFWAYLVTKDSKDRFVRYSGYLGVLNSFLYEAGKVSDLKTYIAKIDRRVIADLKREREHWRSLRDKKMDKVQTRVNDAYLKTNRVQAGVQDYNRVVALILGWNKVHGFTQ